MAVGDRVPPDATMRVVVASAREDRFGAPIDGLEAPRQRALS